MHCILWVRGSKSICRDDPRTRWQLQSTSPSTSTSQANRGETWNEPTALRLLDSPGQASKCNRRALQQCDFTETGKHVTCSAETQTYYYSIHPYILNQLLWVIKWLIKHNIGNNYTNTHRRGHICTYVRIYLATNELIGLSDLCMCVCMCALYQISEYM